MLTFTPSHNHSPAIVAANGPVSLYDVKKVMRALVQGTLEFGIVWDMRKAELGAFHSRDMKDVAETIPAVLPVKNSYRVAIIGCGTLQFGLYRAFLAYAEFAGLKREYGYFVDPIEANEWIGAGSGPKQVGIPGQSENLTALSA